MYTYASVYFWLLCHVNGFDIASCEIDACFAHFLVAVILTTKKN